MTDLYTKLNSENIAQYLLLNKWVRGEDYIPGRVREYLTPDQEDAILLPMDNSFTDYFSVLERALKVIAEREHLSLKRLCTKLINPSCDLLSWRINDESTVGGAISFNSMYENIGNIKDMLGSACLDILNPTTYHNKVNIKEVQEQLSLYKFGQTEVGSYILNVLCPLGYYQYQLFDADTEQLPISRRINLNILSNISRIQKSAEEGSAEMRETVDEGTVSVNFLNSLASLYEANKDSELSISAVWNKDIPLLEEPVNNVSLNPRCIDAILTVVEEYTPKKEQNVKDSFYGKIVKVEAEAEVDNRKVVDVKIATIGEELRTVTVNASLNYAEYFGLVQQAFQDGLDVRVSGIRTSTARSIKLSDAMIEIAK